MCSISWAFNSEGYELAFNRDEQWDRPHSLSPKWEKEHTIAGICSRDAKAGGTWLFTNQHGITLALLNAYPDGKIFPPGKISRGALPLLAAECETICALREKLQAQYWNNFSPCHLLLFSANERSIYTWNGESLSTSEPYNEGFFTSSSVHSETVVQARNKRYRAIRSKPPIKILKDTTADKTEEAIYVTRNDAGTVSQIEVIVTGADINFTYTPRGGSSVRLSERRIKLAQI